jgi:tetratricopeptide (TPR) repeat protein
VNYAFHKKNPDNPMVDAPYRQDWEKSDPLGKAVVDKESKVQDGKDDAAQWFEAERASLVDLVQRASAMSPSPSRAPHLAFSLFYLLEAGGHREEWEQVTERGYQMALELDDVWAQARLMRNIARLEWTEVRDESDALKLDSSRDTQADHAGLERCLRAISLYEKSDALYQQCDAHPREAATVRRELADVYLEQARLDPDVPFERAIQAYRDAEQLFSQYEHSENPIGSLNVPLSVAYRHMGMYHEADRCLNTALDYAQPPDNQSGPVHARTYCYALLRRAELRAEQYNPDQNEPTRDTVLTSLDRAVKAFHDDNNWLFEARTLARKGSFLESLSQSGEARVVWVEALAILTRQESKEGSVVQAWIDRLDH